MGSFYANIHLRTHNRPLVERAWASYWEERGEQGWCWVSPPYGQWVSVFDWRCDQQQADVLTDLASTVSRAVECPTLAFQIFDSDLAEYWLFNNGVELDHYTSNSEFIAAFAPPQDMELEEGIFDGYGPDSGNGYAFNEDQSDGGNVALLKSLLNASVSDIELEAILRTPARISDDILTALASALGINDTWAALGYHYLLTEGDTVPGFEDFHHLPPSTPPNPQRASELHEG